MKQYLEADSIQLSFGERKILSGIYIKSETGKITGILGRNGEGKSCLMRIIYGSLKCESSIRFNGKAEFEVYRKPHLLVYLPQFNFIPKLLSLKRIFEDFEMEFSIFENLFPEFSGRQNRNIQALSGGERRLIELYVILKSRSRFVMLDEPFTHLNPIQIEKVKDLLIEEKKNKGLIVTDHMYRHILDVSDHLYVLANGRTYLTKTLEDIEALGYVRNIQHG
jgi:ABC-type branched-subunit amino acid transport system ATPase component